MVCPRWSSVASVFRGCADDRNLNATTLQACAWNYEGNVMPRKAHGSFLTTLTAYRLLRPDGTSNMPYIGSQRLSLTVESWVSPGGCA